MKKNHMSKKNRQKRMEKILIVVVGAILVVGVVWGIVDSIIGGGATISITSDGHIHAADGTHIGSLEDILGEAGEGATITEDGHIHAADGTHLGSLEDILSGGEAEHEHTEDE